MKTRTVLVWSAFCCSLVPRVSGETPTRLYSHGAPTGDEQYLLELTNRARSNPSAEGAFLAGITDPQIKLGLDYFKVDLARLKKDFNGYPVRPPLAFNSSLMASSRRHSKDMGLNHFQTHVGTDGSTLGTRTTEAGYLPQSLNESIYSDQVSSPLFCHVGLNVDWGVGAFGVQPGLGHRMNIMGAAPLDNREVGISVFNRSGSIAATYGALSVTQDFGTQIGSPDFLVGVAYYDVNGNGICDSGEGLPGIKVMPANGTWYAVTSSSGGYAIPFSPASGANSVTFSGGGLKTAVTRPFSLSGQNVKVDLRVTSGLPYVCLQKITSTATESGGVARFRLVRVGPVDQELKIALTRTTKAATGVAAPADYILSAISPATVTKLSATESKITVTIPKNSTFADLQVTAVADKLVEPPETATFSLSTGKTYLRGATMAIGILITP